MPLFFHDNSPKLVLGGRGSCRRGAGGGRRGVPGGGRVPRLSWAVAAHGRAVACLCCGPRAGGGRVVRCTTAAGRAPEERQSDKEGEWKPRWRLGKDATTMCTVAPLPALHTLRGFGFFRADQTTLQSRGKRLIRF